jgi:DnaJ-class molecular chaperone
MDLGRFLKDLGFAFGDRPATDELKKRWKELCRKFHPDNQETGSRDDFQRVTHAYKMLTDASYRNEEAKREMRRGSPNARGDLDVRLQVPITFEDAFFGRTVVLSFNVLEFDDEYNPKVQEKQETLSIKVSLPAGCVTGFQQTEPGKGHICGAARGDIHMLFIPKPHPRFRVEGLDVVADEEIPLEMMLRGGKVEVMTMYGLKTLRIPPGSGPDQKLRIKKSGVMETGNHIVVLHPRYPTAEELRGEKWKGMDINWEDHELYEDKESDQLMNLFIKLNGSDGYYTVRSR